MASSKGWVGRFLSRLTLSEELIPLPQTSLDTNDELNEMRVLNRTVTSKTYLSQNDHDSGGEGGGRVSLASVTMITCLLQQPFFWLTLDCK